MSEIKHNHQDGGDKKSELFRYNEWKKSRKIFHHKYLHTNKFQDLLFNISTYIGYVERAVYFSIKYRK